MSDVDGTLQKLACRLGDQECAAELLPKDHLVKRFQATLDTGSFADGVYELVLQTQGTERAAEQKIPVIVRNGRRQPFALTGTAKLQLRVMGAGTEGGEILVNGERVGAIPASPKPAQNLSFALPPEVVRRLNEITVRAAAKDNLQVTGIRITRGKTTCRDVRFAPGRPVPLPRSRGASPSEKTFYIDLTYQGPRGT